jgi:signal recognition particle subunit SRP54
MFENLSDRLERSFQLLRGQGKITEINVAETLKDVRRALLDADVNYKIAKQFTEDVKTKALGQDVLKAIKPKEMMVKIVHDELAALMGGENADVNLKGNPAVILMSGLQGSGKTTFSGKLAKMLQTKRSKRPLLVACDVYRPAAIEQLKVLGASIDVPVYAEPDSKNPIEIALNAIAFAKKNQLDLVIIDTAGRLAIDEVMMTEIAAIKKAVNPHEILFVVDAMTGQDAVNVAKDFDVKVGVDGVVLSKMDGDARGGAALSVKAVTGKPILYIGMGEKLSDLEQFYPDRMANRILGMGDVLTLIEKVQENIGEIDEDKEKQMAQKLKKGKFDFEDYLESMTQMKKMGGMSSVLGMMGGMGGLGGLGKGVNTAELESMVDDKKMARTEAIILSMTKKERQNPDILNPSRKHRIAKGAGVDIAEVNRLVKQFEQSKKMMKQLPGMMGGMGKRGKFKSIF